MTLEQLYREHFRFVWRSLRRLGVSEADASDAAQEVFLVVHRKLASFEGRSKITTWLFGICLRVASDRRAKAYVRRETSDEVAVNGFADSGPAVDVALEARERSEKAELLLADLPLDQRAVLLFFELDGLTGEAIADLLGVPLGTVYNRLRLAREAVKKAVARDAAKTRFSLESPSVGRGLA